MSMKSIFEHAELVENRPENDALNRTEEERKAEESIENAGRTYTQEEVNEIIKERLRRKRAKTAPTPEEQREADLAARELTLKQREYLHDHGLPIEDIMDFFSGVDVSNMLCFERSVDMLLDVGDCIRRYAEERQRLDAAGIDDRVKHNGTLEKSILQQIFKLGGHLGYAD